MSATNLWEDDLLDLIFTNVAAPNMGDAGGLLPSAAPGDMAIALHTVTVLDTGTVQTLNEAAYTGYVRQTVVRSTAGWTVSSGAVTNDAAISYPTSTSGPESELDVSLGGNIANVQQIFSPLDATLVVNNGVTPEFAISALSVSLD